MCSSVVVGLPLGETRRCCPPCQSDNSQFLPLLGRDQVVNSETPVKPKVREFWHELPARGCDWGSCFRTPELKREPATSGEFAGLARIPRKTGIQRKTPRGTLSAFSVNLAVGESSLTEFSSPKGTLCVTMRAFFGEVELTQLARSYPVHHSSRTQGEASGLICPQLKTIGRNSMNSIN